MRRHNARSLNRWPAMQRSPELQPLSRQHNQALLLAREARRSGAGGDPQAVAAAWRRLKAAHPGELEPHFAQEEALLFPHLREHGRGDLADRLQREHDAVRRTLARTTDLSAQRLRVLGEILEHHVRSEEREAFPFLERVLGAPQLTAIEATLTAGATGVDR